MKYTDLDFARIKDDEQTTGGRRKCGEVEKQGPIWFSVRGMTYCYVTVPVEITGPTLSHYGILFQTRSHLSDYWL